MLLQIFQRQLHIQSDVVTSETSLVTVLRMTASATVATPATTQRNAPVSYTHLDVYKRQLQDSATETFRKEAKQKQGYGDGLRPGTKT